MVFCLVLKAHKLSTYGRYGRLVRLQNYPVRTRFVLAAKLYNKQDDYLGIMED